MNQSAAPRVALALSALSVVAYVSFWATRESPHAAVSVAPSVGGPAVQLVPPVAPPEAAAPPRASAPAAAAEKRFDETAVMTELRALRVSAPEQALSLAQQANAAYPDTPGAAERAWLIVRSLEDLGRFHEAREVALAMRDRYPGTSWTNDVERHVLVHPLDYPSREAQQAALEVAPTTP